VKIEENATESQRVLLDEMKGLREKVSDLERMIAEGGGWGTGRWGERGRLPTRRSVASRTKPWEASEKELEKVVQSLKFPGAAKVRITGPDGAIIYERDKEPD
jgi:hypothetical protein